MDSLWRYSDLPPKEHRDDPLQNLCAQNSHQREEALGIGISVWLQRLTIQVPGRQEHARSLFSDLGYLPISPML